MKREHRPGVLVCYEKHATVLYWAVTQEQLYKHALDILTDRFQNGWYYSPELDNSDPEIPYHQIDEMPEGSIKKAAITAYRNWQRRKKQNIDARDDYKAIKYTVESSKDGEEAWFWLRNMNDGEYERIELVYPEGDLPG